MNAELDFSVLANYPRAVIVAHGHHELGLIETEMRKKYPTLMYPWRPGSLKGYTNGVAYIAPHIYDHLSYTLQVTETKKYWAERDYEFVEFERLLISVADLGELEQSDFPLSSFIGG